MESDDRAESTDLDLDAEQKIVSRNIRALRNQVTALKTQLSTANGKILPLEKHKEELEAQIVEAQRKLSACTQQLMDEKSKVSACTKEIASLEAGIEWREKLLSGQAPSFNPVKTEKRLRTPEAEAPAAASAASPGTPNEREAKKARTVTASADSSISPIVYHPDMHRVLKEVYSVGTSVLFGGEKAKISGYNELTHEFRIVRQNEETKKEEVSVASYEKIIYQPEVGEEILVREPKTRDNLERYYRAKVITVCQGGIGRGHSKNSTALTIKWVDYPDAPAEEVRYRSLPRVLPIHTADPIMNKLKFTQVDIAGDKTGARGKGYFLNYLPQPSIEAAAAAAGVEG